MLVLIELREAAAASPLPAYVAVKVPDEPPAHVMVGGADGL